MQVLQQLQRRRAQIGYSLSDWRLKDHDIIEDGLFQFQIEILELAAQLAQLHQTQKRHQSHTMPRIIPFFSNKALLMNQSIYFAIPFEQRLQDNLYGYKHR